MLRSVHLHPSLVGQPLPWDVFTEAGVLVASAGTPIHDAAHFQRLIARPLYRETAPGDIQAPAPGIHVLERLETLAREAETLLAPPYSSLFSDQLREWLAAMLKTLRTDPDACLGYAWRVPLARPAVHHSLRVLVVSILLSDHLDFSEAQQFSLAGAALTMNLAVLDLLDRLHQFPQALREEDRQALAGHPEAAVALLRQGGVEDADWLQAVAQHHEHADGSGHPRGLAIADIGIAARVLRAADVYCTRLEGRHYRPPRTPRTAMQAIFGRERPHLDPQIGAQLPRVMGLMPPGTLVRLANGESACVTRRGRGGKPAFASSFLDARGRLMDPPRERPLDRPLYAPRGFLEVEPRWPEIPWKQLWGYR